MVQQSRGHTCTSCRAALPDLLEVIKGKGEPHGEHEKAKQVCEEVAAQPGNGLWPSYTNTSPQADLQASKRYLPASSGSSNGSMLCHTKHKHGTVCQLFSMPLALCTMPQACYQARSSRMTYPDRK